MRNLQISVSCLQRKQNKKQISDYKNCTIDFWTLAIINLSKYLNNISKTRSLCLSSSKKPTLPDSTDRVSPISRHQKEHKSVYIH